MKPHAFIAMPFGIKPAADGTQIDFDRVYAELIQPALESANFDVFRADKEERAGDIITDMLQELLVADIVVVDLTIDNPNVWYELGVRHALRKRGVILVQGPRTYQPFDIYTERKLRYSLKDGAPDSIKLNEEIKRLATMAKETFDAPTERIVSPVYSLLPHLQEPNWRDLLLNTLNEFSQVYDSWKAKMDVARLNNYPGDLLVLAEETPTLALRLEAKRLAGESLMTLKQFGFALEQFEGALAIDDKDEKSRQKKAVCLGRLGLFAKARVWIKGLTDSSPKCAESWALSGRIEKENWIACWRSNGTTAEEWCVVAKDEDASLGDAIAPYLHAFRSDPRHFFSGINALSLSMLRRHLDGDADANQIDAITGGVCWAVQSALAQNPNDYWARISWAELSLLFNEIAVVERDYKIAMATQDRDWFSLDSSRQTLLLLRDLKFRPTETNLALAIIDKAIEKLIPPFMPRKVFLFSGHMVDAPDRKDVRFPANKVAAAETRIATVLDELGALDGDVALTQGAAGGDLIFAKVCGDRGVRLQLMLPFPEPKFIDQSILSSDQTHQWLDRFNKIKSSLQVPLRVMPDELGPVPKGVDPYERCNRWLLNTALAYGVEKVHFICLWDGKDGGVGGTSHMYQEVKRRTGQISWIDTGVL